MKTLSRLRIFHACLAIIAVTAYATGEAGSIHAWFGYGVACLIIVRLIWATSGVTQLGLSKFYPNFVGLKLGNAATHPAISRTLLAAIALLVVGAAATGIWMDQGKTIGFGQARSTAYVADAADGGEEEHEDGGMVGEVHETLANALVVVVAFHVLYLLLFKRPLALFMLFIRAPHGNRRRRDAREGDSVADGDSRRLP